MRSLIVILALLGYCSGSLPAQVPGDAGMPLHQGGPTYSRLSGADPSFGPLWPEFDAVVPLDPKLAPQAYSSRDWSVTWPDHREMPVFNVRRFADTGYGVAVILALDVSGSMKGGALNSIRNSVTRFVDAAQPQDRVAVATIADETRWDVPFTAHSAEVKTAIAELAARGHETHLYDGLLDAIEHFEAPLPRRHVLVVMSDGHDEGSQHTLAEVIAAARKHAIAIEAIGVTHSDPKYLKSLQAMAEQTGGSYAAARSEEELDQLIGSGIDALHQTPVVRADSLMSGSTPISIPLTFTWKPQQIKVAVTLWTEPVRSARYERQRQALYWIGGGILLLLLLIGITRRRRTGMKAELAERMVPMMAAAAPEVCEAHVVRPVPAIPADKPLPLRSPSVPAPDAEPTVVSKPPARPTRMAHTFPDGHQGPIAFLDAASGPLAGTCVAVDRSPFRIGADPGNELSIAEDVTLSSRHAQLLLERSILMLEDLSSTNGTWVNGVRTTGRMALAPGDQVKMGASSFFIVNAA